MAYEFKLIRQVDFADTDMAGIMHFSNFFRFMEATEAAFFRRLGLCLCPAGGEDAVYWPRVHADCDYRFPLRFEDEVEVHLLVREKRQRSIAYTFIFRKLNEFPVQEAARGTLIAVCVKRDRLSGKMRAVAIPEQISRLIETAPEELLEAGERDP